MKEIRKAWGRKHFTVVLEQMDKVESYDEVDTTLGQYLTFAATVIEYGGWEWQPAVDGAIRTWERLALLGGEMARHRRGLFGFSLRPDPEERAPRSHDSEMGLVRADVGGQERQRD